MNQPRARRIWSNLTRAGFFILGLGLLGPPAGHSAAPTEDGIFATFEVTRGGLPLGVFHCKLEHELVPRTVANFVGLAEGSRAWVNFQKAGLSHEPFYNGRVIFRVVSNFVIQSGSANDTNSGGGPGYSFHDEFHPSLRHTEPGVLSMANSGPDSNTSQFFITLAQGTASHLDDVHNVFGEVTDAAGLTVLQSIQVDDVFASVTITRNGAAAQAFDVNAHGLPSIEEANPILRKTESGFELDYELKDEAEYYAFHSDDLTAWQRILGSEFFVDPPEPSPRDVSALTLGKFSKFFTVARVQHTEPPAVTVGEGNRVSLVVTPGGSLPTGATFTFNLQRFNVLLAGTYTTSLAEGSLFGIAEYTVTYSIIRNGLLITHRARLEATISGLAAEGDPITGLDINLDFNAKRTVSGVLTSQSGTQFPFPGIFTLSDL